jgi:hypothetical protein
MGIGLPGQHLLGVGSVGDPVAEPVSGRLPGPKPCFGVLGVRERPRISLKRALAQSQLF